MQCVNGHDIIDSNSPCAQCATSTTPSSPAASRSGLSLKSRKVQIGIAAIAIILVLALIGGKSSSGGSKTSKKASGSPAASYDNKITRCTLPLAGWVMYVEEGLSSNDGGSASMRAYYTFGTTSNTAEWIVTEAAQYLRDSYQIGNSSATVNMATAVRRACSNAGYPQLEFPPN